jgi:hypothetical protein
MNQSATANHGTEVVGIHTLGRFLYGDRDAILALASTKGLLGIGLMFVLSAALAREYDGADLLAEPRLLVLPAVASLATSFLLFCLVFDVATQRGIGNVAFGPAYLRFLGLYWMTAPLAWLYAIPVERFMTPLGATQTNLALLGLVAAWRVWLMTCVVRDLFDTSRMAAWALVLLFADVVALVAIVAMPKPIFSIMGGISHTPSEIAILDISFSVGFACVVTLPAWLIATLVVRTSRLTRWTFAISMTSVCRRPSVGLRLLALVSVAAWAFVLPKTQPQQALASRVDRNLKRGRIADALREMAAHEQGDFPARWDPPPQVGFGEAEPPILDVMEAMVDIGASDWVRKLFTEKFARTSYIGILLLWPDGSSHDQEVSRFVGVLLKLPEGPSFAARNQDRLKSALEQPGYSDARRADIQDLLDLAKTYDPEVDPKDHFNTTY